VLVSVTTLAAAVLVGIAAVAVTSAQATGADAISSTTNIGWATSPGNGSCLNGGPNAQLQDPVNCNSFTDKQDVWLSGLPGSTGVPDGQYYFDVLTPGGKLDLSLLAGDLQSDRMFTITDGTISYLGNHQTDNANNKVQVYPYADTTNNGGVYILAVCSVSTGHCKNDAFKVKNGTPVSEQGAPTASKTAVPTHDRNVSWTINKTVDGVKTETFNQAGPATLGYSVTVTKTALDTYGLAGVITADNSSPTPLDVTIEETGLDPALAGSSCTLNLPGNPTVVTSTLVAGTVNGPGEYSIGYTCTFSTAPDASTSYTNTASVGYDIGNGPESLDIASDPFLFPAPHETGAPETITVSDPNAPLAAGFPKTASDTTTWTYQQTILNHNCQEYDNTAAIVETNQSSSTAVFFCGPNDGGLTMGWWQNKNGQALLKANLSSACSTVNSHLPVAFAHGTLTYLPDAYQQNKTFISSAYNYLSAQCTVGGTKSFLPAFDLNVFTAANASGTGTMMVEGQWFTTAMDTATYTVSTSAGKPTLGAGQKVQIPSALQTGLGLNACDTVGNLLTSAAAQYQAYAPSKTTGVTPALITLLNAINNNQAITCL
jgi:hypothetical protein